MPQSSMPRTLPGAGHRREPELASSGLLGGPTPDARTDEGLAEHLIAGVYDVMRAGVKTWGGQASLAAFWGMQESNLSQRLARKVVGSVQYAFLDFLAIAGTNPLAAAGILDGMMRLFLPVALSTAEGREIVESMLLRLADALGFDPPKRKRKKTPEELHAALVKRLRLAGELGEAAIRRAAQDIGADPSEYDL